MTLNMDYIICIFHPLWTLLSLFVKCKPHFRVSCFILWCVASFSVFGVRVLGCNAETSTSLNQEYLLKEHKIIEATPRALNRDHSDQMSTALVTTSNAKVLLDPCSEQKSYEAIRTLHRQLDDDADGIIDVAESDEFIRDELQTENVYERHREFHENDQYINVDELWQVWTVSEVHNWTVQETVEWLISYVELPQYEHTFRNNGVDGTCLPRMAINSNSLLSVKLGIKDPIHRQKIALKAMDVVLFGAPTSHNYWKDGILAASLLIAIGGCWFAYVQHKHSQTHMQRMMKDMEALQKAETALFSMQEQLNKAKEAQEIVNIEKQDLERRLLDEMKTSTKRGHVDHGKLLDGSHSSSNRLRELEEQLRTAKSSLMEAERRLDSQPWIGPPSLQHWLQLTHELELRNHSAKRAVAEQQLQAAKEGCEKLRKKRTSFMGTFRIAHGGSIDDVDDRIMQAKTALAEVTNDLQERSHRWKQIEKYCGFPITQNPGITCLESILKPPVMNGAAGIPVVPRRSSSEGNLMRDEQPPPYAVGIGAGTLVNIPPPKYSKTSPSYSPKATIAAENARSTAHGLSSSRSHQSAHCLDTLYQDILEADAEDDDQFDDDERSGTPTSCSSYNTYSEAASRHPVVESVSSSSSPPCSAMKSESDTQHATNSNHSQEKTVEKGVNAVVAPVPEERKKKKSVIVAALKGSFSTSNLSKQEETSSESACSLTDSKKKKKLFSTLRQRKEKKL